MPHLLIVCSFSHVVVHEVLSWIQSNARLPAVDDDFVVRPDIFDNPQMKHRHSTQHDQGEANSLVFARETGLRTLLQPN